MFLAVPCADHVRAEHAYRHRTRATDRLRRGDRRGHRARPSRSHRPARRRRARLVASGPRRCPGTRQGARSRTTPGPAARHPDGREGHHRFARPADDLRLADLQDAPAAGRCRDRGAGARRRRDPARQDGDDRVRQPPSRPDPQPAQSRPYAGRLVVRLGRGGRRLPGDAGHRHADRRLGDPARRLLRRRRLQAELRPFPAGRHEGQHRMARHDRRLCAQRRGHRAVPRRADGDALSADRQARQAAAHRGLLHPSPGRAVARGHARR